MELQFYIIPQKKFLKILIAILKELDKLYIVDIIRKKKNEKLKNKFIEFSSKIKYIKLNGNKGIAKH